MKVITLGRFEPIPVGHGGNHRSYQILWDCYKAVGETNVIPVTVSPWKPPNKLAGKRYAVLWWKLRRHLRPWLRHPIRSLFGDTTHLDHFIVPGLLAKYEKLVHTASEPVVCVMEDVRFSPIIPLNEKYGIPTFICPHNIESLDVGLLKPGDKIHGIARFVDFLGEFTVLSRSNERFFISKAETALIGGVGLTVKYYPYWPVGEIAEGLQIVRQKRKPEHIEAGLFLIVGTAKHTPTVRSLQWFVKQLYTYGLPEGVKVVVVGRDTDKLLNIGEAPKEVGVEFRGWVEQEELDDLLSRVCGVLIPQFYGFGALTRLPELAMAGIPAIVSEHPLMAIDPLPGIIAVDKSWDAWYQAIQQLSTDQGESPSTAPITKAHDDSVLVEGLKSWST